MGCTCQLAGCSIRDLSDVQCCYRDECNTHWASDYSHDSVSEENVQLTTSDTDEVKRDDEYQGDNSTEVVETQQNDLVDTSNFAKSAQYTVLMSMVSTIFL